MSDAAAQARDLAKLEDILRWAKKARDLDRSPLWKTDLDAVLEEYGDACDAVWAGLNQLLDVRAARGEPVSAIIPPPDYRKQVKHLMLAALKKNLPAILQEAVEAAVDEVEL